MGKFVGIMAILVAVGLGVLMNKNYYFPIKVPPQRDGYFGPGAKTADDTKIVPFSINVSESVLDDLNERLDRTRFTYDTLEGIKFEYGFNMAYLKKIKQYWRNTYDWRKHEKQLNQFAHFKTQIEGMHVHFMEAKPPAGKYKTVVPLLLVHGWPGSVYEFYKILPMLTDPKAKLGTDHGDMAFHVIAPSIPGYGWSEAPRKPGFSPIAAARIFHKLMKRLKFDRYVAQGGDWGSIINTNLAQAYPEAVIGLHINMAYIPPISYPILFVQQLFGVIAPSLVLHPSDYWKVYPMGEKFIKIIAESGYMHLQATKPDTAGFSLNNSPLGLAAYIIEKFSTWTNYDYRGLADGGLERHFTMDELLTNIMIYWTTESIATSQRFYRECFIDPDYEPYQSAPVLVPTGVAAFPNEFVPPSPRNHLAYKFRNITLYTDMPRGGHFAAFEEPKLLADDMFRFVATVQLA